MAQAGTPPTVSIVIPAYNEENVIGQCIQAALFQSVQPLEILVIDNKSTDHTVEQVRKAQLEFPDKPIHLLHQEEAQGLIPTRNYGLDRAQGEVVGRIDADSLLEPNWVEEVGNAFRDPSIDATTGPVLYYDMPLRRWGHKTDNRMRKLVLKLTRGQFHFLFGSNMAIRRTAWTQIRDEVCRDQRDEMHEDIDISLHLADHNLGVKYLPKMVSGMSARRLEDSPEEYRYYVTRFERTYRAHNVNKPALKLPMLIFMGVYYPGRLLRRIHVLRSGKAAERGGQIKG